MQTIQHSIHTSYLHQKESVTTRFMNWCGSQEPYRYGWLALILALHGCVLAPISLLVVFMNGTNMFFLTVVSAAMAASLITNLAAMPTKITIPVFFLGLLLDLAVIGISLAQLAG